MTNLRISYQPTLFYFQSKTRALVSQGKRDLRQLVQRCQAEITTKSYEAYSFTLVKTSNFYHKVQPQLRAQVDIAKEASYAFYLRLASKIKNFIYENRATIFFITCSITTAYISPVLFFSATVIGIVGKVQLTDFMKNHLKPTSYLYPDRFKECLNAVDLTGASLGALVTSGSVAIQALYAVNPVGLVIGPILGGLACGNTLAKRGMEMARQFSALDISVA
jgi:hypothetical protein